MNRENNKAKRTLYFCAVDPTILDYDPINSSLCDLQLIPLDYLPHLARLMFCKKQHIKGFMSFVMIVIKTKNSPGE